MRRFDFNKIVFGGLIIFYVIAQFLIGTYHPERHEFNFKAPADADFLYYAAVAEAVGKDFPPENPAFAGVNLTQPFWQYYPLALLAKITGPYNGIRILNVLYLLIFGLILRRYFPDKYGFPLIILFASSALGVSLNSLGIDLISRGFTHAPFFIMLTLALFSRATAIRLAAIGAASFLNGYMMLMILPGLALWYLWKREPVYLYLFLAGGVATGLAGLFISAEAVEKPFYFVLTEGLRFDPAEIILHALPNIVILVFYREMRLTLLAGLAVLFGAFFHYNPFFPIFLLYFCGALALASGRETFPQSRALALAATVLLLVFFMIEGWQKFAPASGAYYPHYDERQAAALAWIRAATPGDASFAAISAEGDELAYVMQYRPVYLGVIGHVAHLGLNWRARYEAVYGLFTGGTPLSEVDYIYYGPTERSIFPVLSFSLPVVYQDEQVVIFKAR